MKLQSAYNFKGELIDIALHIPNYLNIKTKQIEYFGYKQGYKVYVNGIKYPRKHGNHHSHLDKKSAIIYCLINDYSYQ